MYRNVVSCLSLVQRQALQPWANTSNPSPASGLQHPLSQSSSFIHSTCTQARESLLEKLGSVLEKIDTTIGMRRHKIELSKMVSLCNFPGTYLSVSILPLIWLQTKLQPLLIRHLKRWIGLARSTDTSRLSVPSQWWPRPTRAVNCAPEASLS